MNRIQTVIVTALLAGAVPLAVQGSILNHRINELETYYTIYAGRFENWSNRALQDEQIIENLQQVSITAQQQPAPESGRTSAALVQASPPAAHPSRQT